MSDPSDPLKAINRFYDMVDNGVDAVNRVLHRSQETDEKLRPNKRREIIDAEPVTERKRGESPPKSASTAVAKRPHYYIVESVDPKGNTLYVVTDGGNARTECTTRAFAQTVLTALEKAAP